MKRDLTIFRCAFLGPIKKLSRLSWSLTGTRRNYNSGQSRENKKKRTTLHYRNTEKRMMPKSES